MSRPRKDGKPATGPNKRNLTELFVKKVKPETSPFNVWDEKERGLVLRVQPTGHRAFKVVYSFRGRPRWYHVGDIGLSDARRIAAKVRLAVAEGKDPVADRQAERGAGSFAELADRYLEAKLKVGKKVKTYKHARHLVERWLFPRWGKLDAKSITRADVEKLFEKITAPVLANRVLAAASPIFNWGIKKGIVAVNPTHGVERNETKSRERVLSDSEVKQFWEAFPSVGLLRSSALKLVLLTGQRPGEVSHMRKEHIRDGWWELPGDPVAASGWPGTKNAANHRVWLSEAAMKVLSELESSDSATGFVFATQRGTAVRKLSQAMQAICSKTGMERATPHDLRRTFSTAVTRLGFDRHAMNRVTNHKEGGIADVYDRFRYEKENRAIMESVASHVMALAEGRRDSNVVQLRACSPTRRWRSTGGPSPSPARADDRL
jgi:integrase